MTKADILVIDDEAPIRKLLDITLTASGFKVRDAASAKEGLALAKSQMPDVILLDLGLPDESGHDVLKKLREWFTKPILILSVQSNEEDIVRALENGANDYLVKPFRSGELIARIKSALRSVRGPEEMKQVKGGGLEIDLAGRSVKKNNEVLKLTATEFDLLALFIKNEGRVLTHQYLLREIWGPGYIEQSQYLRVFVGQLRKKIEAEANEPKHLLTESGVGYRFILKDPED